MRAVNLLKGATSVSTRPKPGAALIVAGAAPVLALALVGAGYVYEHSAVTSARSKLAAVETEIAATRPRTAAPAPGGSELALEQSERFSELDTALASRIAWDSTLVQIARVLPGDVWLTQLNLLSPDPADGSAAPQPGNAFTAQGYTYSQKGVAHLMTRLQLLPILSNITLENTTSSTVGDKSVIQFTLDAQINGPLSAPPVTAAAADATTTTSSTSST